MVILDAICPKPRKTVEQMRLLILFILIPFLGLSQSEILNPKDTLTGQERVMLLETDQQGNRRTLYTGQIRWPCTCPMPDTLEQRYSGIARPTIGPDGNCNWEFIKDNAHFGAEFLKPNINVTNSVIELEFEEQVDLIKAGYVDPDGLLEPWEWDLSINSTKVSIKPWKMQVPILSFVIRKLNGNWSVVGVIECPNKNNAGCNQFENIVFTDGGDTLTIDYSNNEYSGFGGTIIQESGTPMIIHRNYLGTNGSKTRDQFVFYGMDGNPTVPDNSMFLIEKRCESCPFKQVEESPLDPKFAIPLSNLWISGDVYRN